MKKLLLVLVCVMTLSAIDASAQRKTDSYDLKIGVAYGKVTYSYKTSNGQRIYDGPVTVTATDDSWKNTSYGRVYFKRNYSLKANNSNGMLHGAVTMKDYVSSRWSGEPESVTTKSFTANYENGMPHGRFLLDVKDKEDNKTKQTILVDVTYTNGILTGPFKLMKDEDRSDDFYAKGAFNSEGKFDGKCEWGDFNFQFKNGVLVGGDGMSTKADAADISMKFATKQMTEADILARGFMLETVTINLVYKDIYAKLADVLGWSVLVLNEEGLNGRYWNAKGAQASTFVKLIEVPYFAENDFEEYLSIFKNSNVYYDDSKLIKSVDGADICFIERSGSKYLLTKEQETLLRETINEANERKEKRDAEAAISKLKEYRLGKIVTIGNDKYEILDIRCVSCDRNIQMVVDVDVRKNNNVSNNNYLVRTFRANVNAKYNDNPSFEFTARITNKYDDVEVAMNAFKAVEDAALKLIAKYRNDAEVAAHPGVERLLTTFSNYYNPLRNININHKDLDATIKTYDDNSAIISGFNMFIPYYIEASKLDNKLETTVSQHTLTPRPELVDWQATTASNKQAALLEDIKGVITTQKQLLENWATYSSLKEKVATTHGDIQASDSLLLAEYNAMYITLTAERTTLSDGIVAYEKFFDMQKSIKEYVAKYYAIEAKHAELLVSLKPAKSAAKAYQTYYSALDFTWKPEGASEQLEEVAAKQNALQLIVERPTLANDEKRVKKLKLTDIDELIKAYNE